MSYVSKVLAVLLAVLSGIGTFAPGALDFIHGLAAAHPALATVGALLSVLGTLFMPQPHK